MRTLKHVSALRTFPLSFLGQTGSAGTQSSHLIDAACEVLSAPTLAEIFWEMVSGGRVEILKNNCQSSTLFVCFVWSETKHGPGNDSGQRGGNVPPQDRTAAAVPDGSRVKQIDC